MNEQTASAGLGQVLFGTSVPHVTGDRRQQAAIVVWVAAAVCFVIGMAPIAENPFSQPTFGLIAIGWTVVAWIREAYREQGRGLPAAIAIATARIGFMWLSIIAILAAAWLVGLVTPDDLAWLAAWWLVSAALAVIGALVWQRERRQQLAALCVCAGVLIAFGSLAGYATGGPATIVTVIGAPTGLAIIYASGKSAG